MKLEPEIMIINEYNGLFITQAGQSTKQTALLTNEMVVNTTMAQFGESSNYINSFGKDLGSNNNSASFKNIPYLNLNKKSGGSKSGGAYSGGKSAFFDVI